MVSRALGLAAVLLLVCGGLVGPTEAQENLDAGKSPSQLFSGNCNACHKSPRGLLKTVAPGSLPGFLRQHYTTGPEMAGVLSTYLISNGAGDVRGQGKGGKPDAASSDASEHAPRAKRHGKRSATEAKPDGDVQAPAQADEDQARQGHKSSKRKHGKPAAGEGAKSDAEPAEAPKPAADVHASDAPRNDAPASAPTTTQSIPSSTSGSGEK